jgi:hypothetical protein
MTHQLIPSGNGTTSGPTTQAATANINSEVFDIMCHTNIYGVMGVQVNTASFNAADATLKIQHSNDATNWIDVTDGSITIASGTNSATLTPITQLAMRYYRAVYTKNSNTAGTIQVIISLK